MSRIDEIRERVEKAYKGHWKVQKIPDSIDASGGDPEACIRHDGYIVEPVMHPWEPLGMYEDADFIAHSRDDIPYLLDRIQALEKVAEAAKKVQKAGPAGRHLFLLDEMYNALDNLERIKKG